MAIADILNEIDAYLLRLRHARALLASVKDARSRRERKSNRTVKATKPAPAVAKKPRIREAKSESKSEAALAPQVPALAAALADPAPVAVVTGEPALRQVVDQVTVPIKRLRASRRGGRRTAIKPTLSAEVGKLKPAIALSGSMNRIVVVSPQQVQLEKDRTATSAVPEVRRPRIPSSGLSGRLAFDALFKDTV